MAVATPIAAVLLVSAIASGRSPVWFTAGLVLGGLIALVAVLRDNPPPDVANWGLGARGERLTGEALRALEAEGWQALHDLELRRGGNLDHVVAGPPGVFLLETKTLRGRVSVEDGVLISRSVDDDETATVYRGLRGRLVARSAALARLSAETSRIRPWVHPVVVIWADFRQRVVVDGGVAYVHGEELEGWLRSHPPISHELEFVA